MTSDRQIEFDAMAKIDELLKKLPDSKSRLRVLNWAFERHTPIDNSDIVEAINRLGALIVDSRPSDDEDAGESWRHSLREIP